ncbi:hypothetical protein, variant 2 [Aphanomyces astaci]|nr:hypothetical protein, variant 2 [Aphanomyces astaci]ETV83093.1 hypothetical protein, variant 2 [Aphanomyces astaci]|eukprot:XP_009827767.1 hypothetical protein, variant 2 [Aphanomyces astaci]
MKVELVATAFEDAHFQIQSPYRHLSPGDEVLLQDDVTFASGTWQVQLHVGHGLSVAQHSAGGAEFVELNGSATGDAFFIHRFAHIDIPPQCLRGGDLVRFMHCRAGAFLYGNGGSQDLLQVRLCHQPADETGGVHSVQSLWQVQHVDILNGNEVTVTSVCCVRHVASRQFLVVDDHNGIQTCSLTPHRSSRCQFTLATESFLSGRLLRHDRPLFLKHVATGGWVGLPPGASDPTTTFLESSTGSSVDKTNAFRLQIIQPSEATESLFLLSLLPQLQRVNDELHHILHQTVVNTHNLRSSTLWIVHILDELARFCMDNRDDDRGTPIAARQNVLVEMNCISLVVGLLQRPFVDWSGPLAMSMCSSQDGEPSSPISSWDDELHGSIRAICQRSYKLLVHLVRLNPKTSVVCAAHIGTFGRQVGFDLHAEALVQELLCSSESLVTTICDNVVTLFVTLLRERGRRAEYVDYLTKLCQFKTTGIPAKQVALCGHLFPTVPSSPPCRILLEVRCIKPNVLHVCHPDTNEWLSIADLIATDKALARYFLTTIRMLSSMSWSRNYIAIHAVEQHFPRDAVLAVVRDCHVHTKMRAAFCKLLAAVYVDRLPHEVRPRPKLIFVSPAVSLGPETAQRPAHQNHDAGDRLFFVALKQTLNETLAACEGTLTASQSHLLLGMLPLCLQMMSFGCYTDETELKTLVQVLVPLLKDRSALKKPVMSPTSTMNRLRNYSLRHALPSTDDVRPAVSTDKLHPHTLATTPPITGPSLTTEASAASPMANSPQRQNTPRKQHSIVKCKLLVCQILTWSLHLSLDAQLDALVHWFFTQSIVHVESHALGDNARAVEIDAQWTTHQAPLGTACEALFRHATLFDRLVHGHDLTSALLSLLACEYPALVSAALDLLGSSFNVHRELRKHLDHVIVVPSDRVFSIYTTMQASASVLRLYEETSETWLSVRAGETWNDVLGSLLWFTDALATTDDLVQVQQLVRGLGVDDLVLNITRSLGTFLLTTPRTSSNRVFLRRQEHLLDGCYRFFVLYTWHHHDAQVKLHQQVDFFKDCVAHRHMPASILYALYHNNLVLCRSRPPWLVSFVVDMIDQGGAVAEHVDILTALAVCSGVPIKENQNAISLQMLASHRKPHVVDVSLEWSFVSNDNENIATLETLLESPQTDVLRVRRKALFDDTHPVSTAFNNHTTTTHSIQERILNLVDRYISTGDESHVKQPPLMPFVFSHKATACKLVGTIDTPPRPGLYQAKLLDLLANLTLGANFVCEARLQGLIPLDVLLRTLHRKQLRLPLKCKLVKVLHEGWLHTEQFVAEVAGSHMLVQFIVSQASIVRDMVPRMKPGRTHESIFVWECLLPMLLHYFEHHCDGSLNAELVGPLNDFADMFQSVVDQWNPKWVDNSTTTSCSETTLETLDRFLHVASTLLMDRPTPSSAVQTKPTPTSHVLPRAGLSLAQSTLKSFAKWLHVAPFFAASIDCDKALMLDAFMRTHTADALRRHTRLSVVRVHPAKPNATGLSDSVDFKFIVARLIAHANNSEIRVGLLAQHSTLEVLTILEQVSSSRSTQALLHLLGAPKMVVELSCRACDTDVATHKALVLLAMSLLRNGGLDAQHQFFDLLSGGKNVKWFERVGTHLRTAIAVVDTGRLHPKTDGQDASIDRNQDTTHVLEMLRLLCEGHHTKFQNLLRHQPSSHPSVNIVELVVQLFNELVRTITPASVPVLKKTFQAIVEFIQGPCEGNQVAVVDPTEHHRGGCNFIDSINALLSMSNTDPAYSPGDLYSLKYMCSLALVALVEGRTDTTIHDRMGSLLSMRLLKETLVAVYASFAKWHEGHYTEAAFDPDLLSVEGRQRDNYIVRLIKITLGQAHVPPTEPQTPTTGPDKPSAHDENGPTATPRLGSLMLSSSPPPSFQFMLNAGFNIYILFHRLLEVPGVGHVLRSSLLPSDAELRELDEPPITFMNPVVAAFSARRRLRRLTLLMKSDRDVSYAEAYAFFRKHCASVEVHVGGQSSPLPDHLGGAAASGGTTRRLQRFYFPKPPVCAFLTSDMRDTVMEDINRDSPAEKIQDLFQRSDAIIAEMTHRYLMSFAGDKLFTWGKLVSFGVAIVLNVLLIACYVDMGDPRFKDLTLPFQSQDDRQYHIGCVGTIGGVPTMSIVRAFGLLQVIVSVGIVVLYAFTYGPLIMLEGWKRHAANGKTVSTSPGHADTFPSHRSPPPLSQPSTSITTLSHSAAAYTWTIGGVQFENVRLTNIVRSLGFLLLNPVYVYYVVYLSMAILGFAGHNFLFAFHLFDILLRFPELTIIVHAVAWPWKSLVLSFCLMMIAIYIFAIVGFTYFRHQFPTVASSVVNSTDAVAECGMLLSCYLTTFDQTFKNNGGIGAHLATQTPDDLMNWGPRLVFDNLFNIVILLIIVNIFFGIIIDTFGDQRSRMEARLNDIAGKCFICNLSRETFDRLAPLGFEHHVKNEHDLWNYVFLVAHLRFKSETEFDGVEQFLWRCIRHDDYSFVPLYHALALKNTLPDKQHRHGIV